MNEIESFFKIIRNQILNLCCLFCICFILLSACDARSEPNSTSLSSTVAVASIVPSLVASDEPGGTQTNLPMTPTTLIVTRTPVHTATLTEDELRQKWQMIDGHIAAIMASNNDCQLPCWWGITQGDSVTMARRIFDSVNSNGWVDSNDTRGNLQQSGFFKHVYRNDAGNDLYVGFSIDLLTQDDFIKVIDIYVGRSVTFDTDSSEYVQIGDRLLRDWEQYTVQHVFELFGQPDRIFLLPRNFADGDNFYYEFNLYYNSLGIVFSYSFPLLVDENGSRTICLNLLNMDSMNLYLYDPAFELPNSYLKATYSLWPLASELKPEDNILIAGSDLESRTDITINEFWTVVLNSRSDDYCFAVN